MKEEQVLEVPPTSTAVVKDDLNPILKSVNDLRGLSAALSIFTRRFNELQSHMEFIDKAIDELKGQQLIPAPIAASSSRSPPAPTPLSPHLSIKDSDENCTRSTLEYLCETMGGRGVRKYITSHLHDIAKLREETTAALKRAPNPSKLVLDCVGRFYLQGSRAFIRDSPMLANRQACLLILEFFLLIDSTQIDLSVKEEAVLAALAWRKRLINEGGISSANNADARGLLLFVSSFGIPSDFRNEDLIELIRLSNPREISDALRRSPFLIQRIPDIVKGMVKKGMCVVAVDLACTFDIDDKFSPQTILTSYLRESKEAWKRARRESQGSPVALKEANEKQLATLRTVMKCLEDHKIDPMKLAGWSLDVKIANLEKDITDLDKVIEEKGILKRKPDKIESSKEYRTLEMKRPRTTNSVSSQMHSMVTMSQEQSSVGLTDRMNLYDGRFSSLPNGYPGVSSVTGSTLLGPTGAGNLPETILGIAGGSGGLVAGPVDGISTGIGGALPTGLFSRIRGGLDVDGLVQPSNQGAGSFVWHGSGGSNDNSLGHNFMGPPTFTRRSSFGPASAMEQGLFEQPSTSMVFGNRSSGADLYHFADTVLDGESYHSNSSRTGNPHMAPAAARSHGQTYLY